MIELPPPIYYLLLFLAGCWLGLLIIRHDSVGIAVLCISFALGRAVRSLYK